MQAPHEKRSQRDMSLPHVATLMGAAIGSTVIVVVLETVPTLPQLSSLVDTMVDVVMRSESLVFLWFFSKPLLLLILIFNY